MSICIGFDSHAFSAGGRLVLGGGRDRAPAWAGGSFRRRRPHHAVIDALLGAGGMGDIGNVFSDEDARGGSDSIDLLRTVVDALPAESSISTQRLIAAARFRLSGPDRADHRLAATSAPVNVKAKSNEGMGDRSRRRVACTAVALRSSSKVGTRPSEPMADSLASVRRPGSLSDAPSRPRVPAQGGHPGTVRPDLAGRRSV